MRLLIAMIAIVIYAAGLLIIDSQGHDIEKLNGRLAELEGRKCPRPPPVATYVEFQQYIELHQLLRL